MRVSCKYVVSIRLRVRVSLESSPMTISMFAWVCARHEVSASISSLGRLHVGRQIEILVCRMMSSPWAEWLDQPGAFGLNQEWRRRMMESLRKVVRRCWVYTVAHLFRQHD